MKKITFLFFVLLSFCLSVSAQKFDRCFVKQGTDYTCFRIMYGSQTRYYKVQNNKVKEFKEVIDKGSIYTMPFEITKKNITLLIS